MSEAVREMSRQEMIDEMNRLREKVEKYRTAFESAKQEKDAAICAKMAEIADLNAELEKIRYLMQHVNDVMYFVFGIKNATARSPEDLKAKCQCVVDEKEKALKQIEHDQVKIAELINEIDCKRSEIMPEEPIKVADCLIHAKGTREANILQRVFGGSRRYESYDIYSVSDLKEIAEHLLAYCKNCEVSEDDC